MSGRWGPEPGLLNLPPREHWYLYGAPSLLPGDRLEGYFTVNERGGIDYDDPDLMAATREALSVHGYQGEYDAIVPLVMVTLAEEQCEIDDAALMTMRAVGITEDGGLLDT